MARRIATVLQAIGIAAVAFGVGIFSIPGGIITAGAGAVLFGLAIERGEQPAAADDETIYSPTTGRPI
jgi:hypothetical protein